MIAPRHKEIVRPWTDHIMLYIGGHYIHTLHRIISLHVYYKRFTKHYLGLENSWKRYIHRFSLNVHPNLCNFLMQNWSGKFTYIFTPNYHVFSEGFTHSSISFKADLIVVWGQFDACGCENWTTRLCCTVLVRRPIRRAFAAAHRSRRPTARATCPCPCCRRWHIDVRPRSNGSCLGRGCDLAMSGWGQSGTRG